MPLGRLRIYFGHIIELHYSTIWQRVDVLWQQSHLNLLRMVLCIHLFAISDEFILHRELASGGKSNSTLYNDKFDAINVIILSVPVPIVAIVYDFLTILLRSVKCIPMYTIETMIFLISSTCTNSYMYVRASIPSRRERKLYNNDMAKYRYDRISIRPSIWQS